MLVCSNGPKGLAHGLVDPLATLTLVLRLKIVSLDFMHPLINKVSATKAGMCQSQAEAGRQLLRFGETQLAPPYREDQECP